MADMLMIDTDGHTMEHDICGPSGWTPTAGATGYRGRSPRTMRRDHLHRWRCSRRGRELQDQMAAAGASDYPHPEFHPRSREGAVGGDRRPS